MKFPSGVKKWFGIDSSVAPPEDKGSLHENASVKPSLVEKEPDGTFVDHVVRAREELGSLLELGTEAGELQMEIKGIPDIGPDGRFLLWSLQDPDGEIHPVLQGEVGLRGSLIDARKAYDKRIFTTLGEVSPFHSRAWMGRYVYPPERSVKPLTFPPPRELRVHGVDYHYGKLVGEGGMGMAVKYVAEDGRAVVMKIMMLNEYDPSGEIRAIEEATYHAVINPELDEVGEPTSPLARHVRRADGKKPNVGSRHMVKSIDSVYLETKRPGGPPIRAVGTILEYLPGKPLNKTIKESEPHHRRKLSEQGEDESEYHQLLEDGVQDGIIVAEGLTALHADGIEHRDLKPQNLVRGEDDMLRIIDPGIARGDLVRALRTVGDTASGNIRPAGERRVFTDRQRNVHGKLTTDVQNFYKLVTQRGEGFVLSRPEYGDSDVPEAELLSTEAQIEIWQWLQKWQRYQYEPMSAKERRDLLLEIVEELSGEEGLLETYTEDLLGLPDAIPSSWRDGDLDALKDLDLDAWQIASAETTNPGRDTGEVASQKGSRGDLAKSGSLTKAGTVMGSPVYMSPEQARGYPEGIERFKSDVFSLGLILLRRTGLGHFTTQGGADVYMRARIEDHCGLAYDDEHIISKEAQRLIREALKKASEAGGKKKTLTVQDKRRITVDILMKRSGRDLLAGLLRKMTLLQPSERPAAKDVLHTLNQVKTHLGKEGARWRALEQAASMEERATAKAEAV